MTKIICTAEQGCIVEGALVAYGQIIDDPGELYLLDYFEPVEDEIKEPFLDNEDEEEII